MADNKFEFRRVLQNVEKLKNTLPTLLANQAQNFFVSSWKKKGWDDGSVKLWKKRADTGKKSQGRALLVKSGNLRRAVENSIRLKNFDKIQLVVALPYASVHNEGYNGMVSAHSRALFTKSTTKQFIGLKRNKKGQLKEAHKRTTIYTRTGDASVKAYTMNMPKRQFMGDSATLRQKQRKLIDEQISKVWRA
jgi:nitric oxide reductase large subunit